MQCTIKKININKINTEDVSVLTSVLFIDSPFFQPVATPVEIAWQGDADNYYLSKFYHDKANQVIWPKEFHIEHNLN